MLSDRKMRLDFLVKQLENQSQLMIKNKKMLLIKHTATLDSLSPLKTLQRGYSLVEDEDGNIIKSKKNVKKDDKVNLVLSDGKVEAKVL